MSILQPTYYTRHPDETYSVADPQPTKQPVKQEPVAWTNYNGAVNNRLKGAPVDAKAIRAEALEEAADVADSMDPLQDGAIAAAIRGLK